VEELQVSRIYADDGPRRRKAPYGGRFAGRGRFRPIVRRSSHITVILAEREIED
jgi:large subunit ribosomal protein L22